MKKKYIPIALALCFINPLEAYAAKQIKPDSVCPDFNPLDVGGSVKVIVPEDIKAEVSITFDSPEVTDEPYYLTEIKLNTPYVFDLEGRDNSADDYRYYNISISLTGGEYGLTSEPFTDRINILDPNENDKLTEYIYTFTVDDEKSENAWDVVSEKGTEKTIAVHLLSVLLGDIDGNGIVDASDASLALAEYSLLSTGSDPTFDKRLNEIADVNRDSMIDATDASKILAYYSVNATGGTASWDEI